MVDLLIQMFKLWESANSVCLSDERQTYLIDEWNKLYWKIEIQILLEPAEKESYQNAVAALSEQIYDLYRKHKELKYLRKLLGDLERLLEGRTQTTRFQMGLLKTKFVITGRAILFALNRKSVEPGLINAIQFVLRDINLSPSKNIGDHLDALAFWVEHQKQLTTEQLTEHLVLLNFNHPQIVEYVIRFYETSKFPDTVDKLYSMQKLLLERQRHLEYLNLLTLGALFPDKVSIINHLLNSLKVDLDFVRHQLRRKFKQSSRESQTSLGNQTILRKMLANWPADKSDLVELAYAMYIYMRGRGSQITIATLVKWFEDSFGVSLSRYSHRFAEIKMRKSTRPSKFLDTMVTEFLNYVEEGDAFLPN